MELVEIGKIINTFGIKGDLKIASSTDFGEQRFAPGSHILVKTPREYLDFEISKHYIHTGFDMIAFKGYTDINEVEKLANDVRTKHNSLYTDVNNTLKPKINSINDRVTALENASQS